jgi:hypothetical protein
VKNDAENQRIVEIEIDVKSWTKSLPTAEQVRPGRCLGCGAPGVEPGGTVVLHGHGMRGRSRWGPGEPGETPEKGTLPQRRYECQRCGAVIVVRPRGVVRHRRYSGAAIVLALWLWSGEKQSDPEVREQVCVHAQSGDSRPERWTTLRRWAKAARDQALWSSVVGSSDWTLRACAERAARVVAALADVAIVEPAMRAFAGAAHAR